ncbi:PREDICTED: transcription factor GTE12 [Camelina sativa]|uniref:Transcription factor GTE12 n=1 Tax=Camelina sativa TaxID=90675 RepID=A0ABM0Y3E1_CAMSA|nr:PREDICTED: transcription factor GTE12 [Camelina sativa]XP_010494831.1 PREDICTED: transcription factor GTE12 [Camelina sativa]XP_010494832.1 PREDICTED: transcription factor GTE12 [Camelina sativa]
MVAIPKLRIKFGSGGSVRTCQTFPDSEKKIEHSLCEDLSRSAEQSRKRGPNEIDDVQPKKKQKLDRDLSSQCLALLRSLMEHPVGWVFNKPVDPVELMIPDYFNVISNPMDFGTIKSKLLKNEYCNADEFAADVRLTFDNALKYNPSDNWVYKVAKEMKEVFVVRWEVLKKKKVSKLSRIGVTEGCKRQPVEVDCSRLSNENSEKGSLSSKPAKVQSKKDTPAVTPKALATKGTKRLDQGLGVSSAVKIPVKGSAQTAAIKCGSCGKTICICLKSCSSSGSNNSPLMDCQVQNTSGAQASESEPQCNGSVTSKNERNGSGNSQLDKPSNSALLENNELKTALPSLPPVPPEKALRAAILKAQYADTILKAKHRKVLEQNNKADLIRIQIEKEQMERAQREEKARIEAEMRAAKVAAQMRAQAELKEKRDKQRLELAEMKRVFDFERNNYLRLDKEFRKVCGCSSLTRIRILVEELGLFLRSDDCPELEETGSEICDAMRLEDLEEGEIL